SYRVSLQEAGDQWHDHHGDLGSGDTFPAFPPPRPLGHPWAAGRALTNTAAHHASPRPHPPPHPRPAWPPPAPRASAPATSPHTLRPLAISTAAHAPAAARPAASGPAYFPIPGAATSNPGQAQQLADQLLSQRTLLDATTRHSDLPPATLGQGHIILRSPAPQ